MIDVIVGYCFVFFFRVKAIEKSEDKDEIAEGTVTVGDPPQTSKHRRNRRRK